VGKVRPLIHSHLIGVGNSNSCSHQLLEDCLPVCRPQGMECLLACSCLFTAGALAVMCETLVPIALRCLAIGAAGSKTVELDVDAPMFVGDNGTRGRRRGGSSGIGRRRHAVGFGCHVVSASGAILLGFEGAWLSVAFRSGAYGSWHSLVGCSTSLGGKYPFYGKRMRDAPSVERSNG
jgi:hypothetical protein